MTSRMEARPPSGRALSAPFLSSQELHAAEVRRNKEQREEMSG